MTAEAVAPSGRNKRAFVPYHKWDRNFFLIWLGLIWLGIVMGFGGDMIHHVQSHAAPFPLIVHVHAVAFVSWLVLLTTQIALVRRGRHDIHMKLGIAGMILAPIMVVLGPAAAIVVDRAGYEATHQAPVFIAVQFIGILDFAGLAGAAFLLRANSSAHKRLILLATLAITDAGFARWLAPSVLAALGMGYWTFLMAIYGATGILALGLGAYDLITRGQLNRVYLPALVWSFGLQMAAVWLFFSPVWPPIALRLIGY